MTELDSGLTPGRWEALRAASYGAAVGGLPNLALVAQGRPAVRISEFSRFAVCGSSTGGCVQVPPLAPR